MANIEQHALFTAVTEKDRYYIQISCSLFENDTMQLEWMFQKALNSGCKYILIDCCKMKNISVGALQVFLSNLGLVQAKGMKLGIFGISPELLNLLNSSEINNLLTIGGTETEVIKLLTN